MNEIKFEKLNNIILLIITCQYKNDDFYDIKFFLKKHKSMKITDLANNFVKTQNFTKILILEIMYIRKF